MVDGVMAVYSDSSREQQLFQPPGTAIQFFTDMHWCVGLGERWWVACCVCMLCVHGGAHV